MYCLKSRCNNPACHVFACQIKIKNPHYKKIKIFEFPWVDNTIHPSISFKWERKGARFKEAKIIAWTSPLRGVPAKRSQDLNGSRSFIAKTSLFLFNCTEFGFAVLGELKLLRFGMQLRSTGRNSVKGCTSLLQSLDLKDFLAPKCSD